MLYMLSFVPLVPLCPVACPVVFHRRNALFMRVSSVFGALSRLSRPPVYIRARKNIFRYFIFLFFVYINIWSENHGTYGTWIFLSSETPCSCGFQRFLFVPSVAGHCGILSRLSRKSESDHVRCVEIFDFFAPFKQRLCRR